jgi:hypothetical protein
LKRYRSTPEIDAYFNQREQDINKWLNEENKLIKNIPDSDSDNDDPDGPGREYAEDQIQRQKERKFRDLEETKTTFSERRKLEKDISNLTEKLSKRSLSDSESEYNSNKKRKN